MATITTRPGPGRLAQEPEHALHLELVEVRGRLVGEEQRRIEAQRARDRDALLLAAGEVGRAVLQPFAQSPSVSSTSRARARPARPDSPAFHAATATLSSALRLGMRLNDWYTTPTVRAPVLGERGAAQLGDLGVVRAGSTRAGVSNAASADSSVVLPQPLAPRSSTSSPSATSRSSPLIGRTT